LGVFFGKGQGGRDSVSGNVGRGRNPVTFSNLQTILMKKGICEGEKKEQAPLTARRERTKSWAQQAVQKGLVEGEKEGRRG